MTALRVLVLDGEQRAALAVTRSLVRAGHHVIVASPTRFAPAALSRSAHWIRLATSPLDDPRGFATETATIARRAGVAVVLPITDASVESLCEHGDVLPRGIIVPIADLATYKAASDKIGVHRLALEVGLGIEESAIVLSRDQPAPADSRLYPGVVKPHRSVIGTAVRSKTGVRMVSDRAACAAVLAELPDAAFPVLVQRRVRGAGVGYFVLRHRGRTVARFAHRRVREKPPSGGVSVLSESVALDPRLQAACDRLLDHLHWEGVAMVECKVDPDRGDWRVIEINGRFWGSLQLAIDSGVDFPALLIDATQGRYPASPPPWRVGQRLRWELGDFDHLLIRMMRSRERLSLPSDAPGRFGALLRFCTFRPGRDHLEVLRLRDPMPFFGELAAWLGLR